MEYLTLLFECPDFVAVDKPSGMHVHPTPEARHEKIFLTRVLERQLGRPVFPVHRLDRATSGVLLVALNSVAARELQELFQSHTMIKQYLTLVRGTPAQEGVIDRPLGDLDDKTQLRPCRTIFRKLEQFFQCALLEVTIEQGRRHQIRRHLAGLMHHLLGDTTYGKGDLNRAFRVQHHLHRLFLHAHRVSFPWKGQNMQIESPLPSELQETLHSLRQKPL